MLNPSVQQKAQEELDHIIGRDRLPDFSDKGSLPYLEAVYKEVLRWFPNAPLGIPHATTKEDEYKGIRIPKGSICFPNAWAMARSNKVYGPDPEVFRPERHLVTDSERPLDPSNFVFGFGRR